MAGKIKSNLTSQFTGWHCSHYFCSLYVLNNKKKSGTNKSLMTLNPVFNFGYHRVKPENFKAMAVR